MRVLYRIFVVASTISTLLHLGYDVPIMWEAVGRIDTLMYSSLIFGGLTLWVASAFNWPLDNA
jgi:hypothetical protein